MYDYNDNIPFLGGGNEEPQPEQPIGGIVTSGKAKIRVVGVGGAGNNAINRMIDAGITSAEYIAVNTDAQILACNKAPIKIQIGAQRTKGLGAGAEPEVGREAAEESKELLSRAIEGTDLLFITAGMGGGTGTGAAPIIAKMARDMKILTVAVVTKPFEFEGFRRMENANKGIDNLRKYVDTLVIIPNEKITEVVSKTATISEAFGVADDVLKQGIRGIADLIVTPALINLDFADVRTVLKDKGLAHMGVGVAKGENRIVEAVKLAVNCPLVDTTIEGAQGVIINFVGGPDLTLDEIRTAVGLIHGVVDFNAMIIFGACIDPTIQDEIEVTVIATGFPSAEEVLPASKQAGTPVAQTVLRPAEEAAAAQAPQPAVRPAPAPSANPYPYAREEAPTARYREDVSQPPLMPTRQPRDYYGMDVPAPEDPTPRPQPAPQPKKEEGGRPEALARWLRNRKK